jgi:hypothetical protein
VLTLLLAWFLGAARLAAQEAADPVPPAPEGQLPPPAADPPAPAPDAEGPCRVEAAPWRPAWGLAGFHVFDGPRVAPNGREYHPSFSTDLDVNFWVWPSGGLYVFTDGRFWTERPEYGVTNGRDGPLGFSKREFDLDIGAAWNYSGPWEARASGYSLNNLNRGTDPVRPGGTLDGALLENRYYLTGEYARLGEPGFDVTRADFLSVGVYPTKDMVGNDGKTFKPLAELRAYVTYDILDWPAYAYGDATLIADRSAVPRLLLFDVGLAARPLPGWRQWEFRAGAENTADFKTRSVLNLWYLSLRYIF